MTYKILDNSFKHFDIHGHQSGNDGWCRIMFSCFHGCNSARGGTSWGFNNRQRCLPPTRPYLMFIEHQHHFCWIPSLAYTLPILPHYIPMFCENPFDQCSKPIPVHPSQTHLKSGLPIFITQNLVIAYMVWTVLSYQRWNYPIHSRTQVHVSLQLQLNWNAHCG